MTERVFGEIVGVPVGTAWLTRKAVSVAGVHRPPMAGISGTKAEGADSIVVSGGYEDDEDFGDEIIYTGAGGNDPNTGMQVADQEIDQPGNAGLITSQLQGLPVRVVRGAKGDPKYSPATGFRYDGLYRVADHWSKEGRSGHRVWQYRLVRLTDEEAAPATSHSDLPAGNHAPGKATGVVTRIIRSTAVSEAVKRLHKGACQICGLRLEVPGGFIAEGAHIKALGHPHNGPDIPSNMLCLCPNHHAAFDLGGVYIDDNLEVYDHNSASLGTLTTRAKHVIDPAYLSYHRGLWGY